MQVTPKNDQFLHHKLPIDDDEKILAVYRHHWFAYAVNWIIGIFIVVLAMAFTVAFVLTAGSDSSITQYKGPIFVAVSVFCVLVLMGTAIPVYLRSQEQIVLTEQAMVQMLQPSLFASKVDHVNLQRIDDVSVRQDFLGTLLGYGHLTIETPGEQDNYEFAMLPKPHDAVREITAAKESYDAAIQAGLVKTNYSGAQQAQAPAIDPQQYEQFLQWQKWQTQQTAQAQPQPPQAEENPGTTPDQPQ